MDSSNDVVIFRLNYVEVIVNDRPKQGCPNIELMRWIEVKKFLAKRTHLNKTQSQSWSLASQDGRNRRTRSFLLLKQ